MFDFHCCKHDLPIVMCPSQENIKLSRLKDRVEKYRDLSNSMSSILTTFEHRLGKLEQTILPVYNETEHLQNRFKSMSLFSIPK